MPEHLFDYEAHLAACARGDRQALQRLYQQEGPRLYGVLLRLVREPAVAEDLLHDAFLRIWAGAGSFDAQRGSARGWIFSVTRHLALNDLRKRQRDAPQSVLLEEVGEGLEASLQSTRIYQCLEQLPSERRACILHAYVDGFSHAEIAAKLGAPLGTVKGWVKRSLVALRECLG
ncbi:sigma-70 family RNA polymerase sigma factor [Pseudomonas sp. TNT2022 ID1025]|uniref:Sigma-70 family RNA polymerase sigma factor n=1 Tax=Pseudomonas rubra TaxID=2942627 RepID=A0ABT5P9X9_9PSED|nr:sigma-70 family RNA polymerase sigma factor [Pseudomonas rubra]MDD1015119.1 sigma-70 family RNA polymerase sigma factor [Pseudomonas rubra]MDD1037698.1 sigma-70 family RNA polymerase sigma factor [Pseudomonas rubra]MDD1157382.1 sigma-70 family RNA polymerase sigma factor [Pseudomonas rubra]